MLEGYGESWGRRSARARAPWCLASLGLAALAGAGCRDQAPSTTVVAALEPLVDAAVCDPDRACARGSDCLQGRCYARCSSDAQCSPRERCSSARSPGGGSPGVCVQADAGLASEPCDSLACFGDTPACHPAGRCVACTDDSQCAGADVCDLGQGRCTEPAPELCAACGDDRDCGFDARDAAVERDGGSGALRCVSLSAPLERVCLVGCASDAECPTAFECLGNPRVCVPRHGTCTAYRAAARAQACSTDIDCSAIGLSAGSPQAGSCDQGRCAFGCADSRDCPGLESCDGRLCGRVDADAGPSDAGTDSGAVEARGSAREQSQDAGV
jgi:hypothetical protein